MHCQARSGFTASELVNVFLEPLSYVHDPQQALFDPCTLRLDSR